MTTRIKGSDTSAIDAGKARGVAGGVRTNGAAPVNDAATAQAVRATDSVSITDAARRLSALQAHIAQLPEVDAARVAELRQAIEQGKYSANAAAIADKLLQLEGDLANNGQQQKRQAG